MLNVRMIIVFIKGTKLPFKAGDISLEEFQSGNVVLVVI